ncbi:STAS domain-containing protein [Streptomyces sp. A1136]|uniref:STAS domain-containing protein n=1 Tax=Streptomyces sp. A1136 TaxID=2563102 RepID=UPI00109E9913|nr:STAS domain-containing protein [Streptomyces sp. A1136]THA44806.1 anti-sigma factor antagonist [Streptomyces sp. A1136]
MAELRDALEAVTGRALDGSMAAARAEGWGLRRIGEAARLGLRPAGRGRRARAAAVRTGEDFRTATRTVAERTIVTVIGEIDIGTGPLPQEALDKALAAGTPRIDIDFSQVTFCDSAGLRARADARDRGIRHTVREVRIPWMRDLFTTTGTDTLLANGPAAA